MKFAELAAEVQVQRCIQPRRDLGLPPGRRRANQLFKEVRNRLQQEGYNAKVRQQVAIEVVMLTCCSEGNIHWMKFIYGPSPTQKGCSPAHCHCLNCSLTLSFSLQNEVIDLSPIYSLAPDWPAVTYCPDTMEEVITKLKTYLVKRIHNREKLNIDLKDKSELIVVVLG